MILYLDASALVKRYVEVRSAIEGAKVVGTVVVSLAEVLAALAKVIRAQALSEAEAEAAREAFRADWPDYVRVRVTEELVNRAGELAWQHSLREYDALHLAAAALWREKLGCPVTFATFDQRLWDAEQAEGFAMLPSDLSTVGH